MDTKPSASPERSRAPNSPRFHTLRCEFSADQPPTVGDTLLLGDWPHQIREVDELAPGRYLLTLRRRA